MVDLSYVLVIVFLVVDFAISIWNAYSAGFSLTVLKNSPGENAPRLAKYASYAALGLAFSGMSYVMTVVFGVLAYYLGYIGLGSLNVIFAFNFLFFGAMIIGFGLVVTAQSIVVAYRRRSFGSIAVSIWNVFAEVLDITVYAEGFRSAYKTLSGGNSRNNGNLAVIVLMAVAVALFITWAAYRHGVKRANQLTHRAPSYQPFGRPIGA